jgi:hypothetical protein
MTYNTMDIDELRRLIDYDCKTGKLTWLPRTWEHCRRDGGKRWNGRYAGKEAFRIVRGYRKGMIKRRMFAAHRVAWALHYGEWPVADIDHINGDGTDNRIINLRAVDRIENCRNQAVRKNSAAGVLGVNRTGGKWRAYISVGGKPKHLGVFDDFKDAVAARKSAEQDFGYHANHGRLRVA